MNYKKSITGILLIALLCILSISDAQKVPYIDSLKNLLGDCSDDSIKLTILYDISIAYRHTSPDEAIKYANQVLELSTQIDDKRQIINAYILLGNVSRNTSKLDEAADYYFEALNISEKIQDSIRMSACYNNIGNIYQSQGNYAKSIRFYEKSLEIEKKFDLKSQISIRYYNIGTIYQLIDSLELAKTYYTSSLKIEEELNSPEGIYFAYYGLASIEVQQEHYDQGLKYFNYALDNAKKANTIIGVASITNELGKLYFIKKYYNTAIDYYQESIVLADSVNYSDVTIDSYKNLSAIYKELKQFEQALNYLERYIALNDSINSNAMKNTIAELETKYETNQKEQTIKQQEDQLKIEQAENDKNMAQMNLLLGGVGLLIILLIFIFRNYRLKKKANDLLAEKNEEISTQHEKLQAINTELEKLSIVASRTDNSVVISDINGEIEWANAGFTRLFGYTKEEFMQYYGNNFIYSSNNPEISDVITNCIKNSETAIYQTKTKTKSGDTIWTQTTLTPVILDNKESKLVAIDTDITKIKDAEREIKNKSSEIENKNIQITNSINYAKKIQQAILPDKNIFNDLFRSSFIFYRPKDIVSGDFYWLSKVDNKIILAIADCTGHGVPGAFMSMIGNTLLNEIVNQRRITNPGDILKELNTGVVNALNQSKESSDSQDDGMDISICSFEYDFSELTISLANHQACLIKNKKIEVIEGDIYSVGGLFANTKDASFQCVKKRLSPGDIIYMYSDGFMDQIGETENKKYTSGRFHNFLTSISDKDMKLQYELLEEESNNWKGDNKQIDDVLIIGIQI